MTADPTTELVTHSCASCHRDNLAWEDMHTVDNGAGVPAECSTCFQDRLEVLGW